MEKPPKNKGGRPPRENELEGLTNLETGEPAEMQPVNYPSMRAAAHALKIDIAILKDARNRACPAFAGSGAVHREKLLTWLKNNSDATNLQKQPPQPEEDDSYTESYDVPDEAGGVGQTLQSLQAYERRLKKRLDQLEKSTQYPASVKAEMIEKAQGAWIKVVNALLKYDLSVSLAKRASGEMIPLADAVKATHALLAWHTVATSDALRNVIPNCELKTKYEIAALLDPAIRSAIYRNFKLGVKLGKIPDWMGKAASEFVASEPPLALDAPKISTNLDDY